MGHTKNVLFQIQVWPMVLCNHGTYIRSFYLVCCLSFSLNTVAIEWCTQVHALNWNAVHSIYSLLVLFSGFSSFFYGILYMYIVERMRVWGFNQFNERQVYIQTLLCAMFHNTIQKWLAFKWNVTLRIEMIRFHCSVALL